MVCSPRPRTPPIYSFRVGSNRAAARRADVPRRGPSTTGRYEFGPARLEGAADGASATAQAGETDSNAVAGVDRNDPTSGPEAGTGGDDGAAGEGGGVGDPPVETPDVDDATDAGS